MHMFRRALEMLRDLAPRAACPAPVPIPVRVDDTVAARRRQAMERGTR